MEKKNLILDHIKVIVTIICEWVKEHVKAAVASANAYADAAASAAAKDATEKVDKILKDAPAAYDTFKELADYINANNSAREALQKAIGDKLGRDELVFATDAEVEEAVTAALEGIDLS